MPSNNPADGASGSSYSLTRFIQGGTPVGDDSRNGQAATGQDRAARPPRLQAGSRSGEPALGAMFDRKRQQKLKPDLQAITDALMERTCKVRLPAAADATWLGCVAGSVP